MPPEHWPEGEVKDATDYGSMCPPLLAEMAKSMKSTAAKNDDKPTKPPTIDEDCLYLNVMTPGWTATNRHGDADGFPVAVLIHGGGMSSGSAREFDWRFLADKYVRHGIVVVVIQYRLGQLGSKIN